MKLLFITSGLFTVPNVEGGAVETLLTDFIDMNERYGRAEVTVACKYNAEAEKLAGHYQNTRFLFYSPRNDSLLNRGFHILNYRFWELFHHPVPKYLYSRQVYDYAESRDFDFFIVEEGDCYSFDYFTARFGRGRMVAHTHSSWPANAKYHSIYQYGIVPSEYTKNTLIDGRWEDYKSTFSVVHNCVNEEQFADRAAPERIRQLRQETGVSSQEFVLLFVGRINREKGIKELIEAMDRLDHCRLLIVGSALLSRKTNSPFEKEIAAMVQARKNVTAVGYVPYSRITDYYSMSDVLVSPGYAGDSCCMVNLEAMMMGLPIISSDNGGIPEYVTAGVNGLLVRTDHITEDIVNDVNRLRRDPALRAALAANNRRDSGKYCRKAYYDSMIQYFEHILAAK